ncbi:hypothetical protein ABT340_35735 [Streptosporangium sp. NPDC000239]|uniref:hypothetical protein n=1 Tax=Streptosporangium sp. NPDC000239 TaxID=3154248 RepID=UPI0033250735
MDDFDQLIADLADLDRRAARARLCLAAGGTQEEVEAIMRGEALPGEAPQNSISPSRQPRTASSRLPADERS